MAALLNRKIGIETWITASTVISVFLFVRLFRAGVDFYAGYPIIVVNTIILLVLRRLVIHRTHALIIMIVALTSVLAAHFSPTQLTAVIAQLVGISLMSICYFSVLLTSGLSVPRWMQLYTNIAFYIAVFGILGFFAQHILHYDPEGDHRLKSIFAEPSLFVYTTLPAVGYYIGCWATERRYGLETLIFLLAYAMADSTLGYFGLLLICAFTFIKRFSVWGLVACFIVGATLLTALYFVSANFRLRVADTAFAISNQTVAHTNGTTFALLSNMYVASHALADHPVLGVGIGGYGSAYDFYIQNLGERDLKGEDVGLNKDDANSLFLRVMAELGPAGLIALLTFLIVCAKVTGKPYRQIRNALLPYFLVRMSRFGAYFSMEIYFFVGLYLLNYLNYRSSLPKPDTAGATLVTS